MSLASPQLHAAPTVVVLLDTLAALAVADSSPMFVAMVLAVRQRTVPIVAETVVVQVDTLVTVQCVRFQEYPHLVGK